MDVEEVVEDEVGEVSVEDEVVVVVIVVVVVVGDEGGNGFRCHKLKSDAKRARSKAADESQFGTSTVSDSVGAEAAIRGRDEEVVDGGVDGGKESGLSCKGSLMVGIRLSGR